MAQRPTALPSGSWNPHPDASRAVHGGYRIKRAMPPRILPFGNTGRKGGGHPTALRFWFANDTTDMAEPYTAATQARDATKDIDLGTGVEWRSVRRHVPSGSVRTQGQHGGTRRLRQRARDATKRYYLASGAVSGRQRPTGQRFGLLIMTRGSILAYNTNRPWHSPQPRCQSEAPPTPLPGETRTAW